MVEGWMDGYLGGLGFGGEYLSGMLVRGNKRDSIWFFDSGEPLRDVEVGSGGLVESG